VSDRDHESGHAHGDRALDPSSHRASPQSPHL
jgi:hypothetical protein